MNQTREKNVYEILGRDSVHPFPARMAPGLALDVIAECPKPLRILDPMSGRALCSQWRIPRGIML